MRAAVLGVVAALVLTVTGCDGGSDPASSASHPAATCPAPVGDEPRAPIEDLLTARAAAVRSGDRRAFEETVAAGKGRAGQLAWFDRVGDLPVQTFRLELSTPSGTADETTYPAYVVAALRLRGIDARPVASSELDTFVVQDGCWRVASNPVEHTEVTHAPWDVPGSTVSTRGGVVLVSDLEPAEQRELLDASATAWTAISHQLRGERDPDDHGVVVEAFESPEAIESRGLYHDDVDLTGAITFGVPVSAHRALDHRVLFSPAELVAGASSDWPRVLRHEFTHVLLADYWIAPTWATEGVAEYEAAGPGDHPALGYIRAADALDLPSGADFYAHTGLQRTTNYLISWAAMRYVAERAGADEPVALVRALDAKRTYTPERTDAVLEDRYGLTSVGLATAARGVLAGLGYPPV